ncbi:site-specific DNA-methyltransferase [Methanococcoides sp. NM1]|uniref:DNA-methyltransferase n=1 Tax=Methanococcoides sp. NM1 TaxID=1201013 RepID=UPI001083F15A|nr:site-specific DNA-methyltransferase [Methanococcoides sp. NM1]
MESEKNTIQNDIIECGDSLELIKDIPLECIDLLVTSPPYWAKRVYNYHGELGLEPTPELFVKILADYFDAFKPHLKKGANVFVNIGDTFFGSGAGAWNKYEDDSGNITKHQKERKEKYYTLKPLQPKIKKNGKLYQNKQLLLIPSRFAIEMQERGWILRDDIIWRKPNRIPASVRDRFNNTYEHVFHFVHAPKYYFNLDDVKVIGKNGKPKNPGDVWDIKTQPLKGSHTATFPEELVERIVQCASPENGVVFDPFLGTGTTWVVSKKLNRKTIGFEVNPEFFDFANERAKSVELPNRGKQLDGWIEGNEKCLKMKC